MPAEAGLVAGAACVSDLGLVRDNNEDNYLIDEAFNSESEASISDHCSLDCPDGAWHAVAVFDGIGGGERGEVASAMTARCVRRYISMTDDATVDEMTDRLRAALRQASEWVCEHSDGDVMGTTATIAAFNNEGFRIVHVGDSRAYLCRDGELRRISRDQTLAEAKVKAGAYCRDDPPYLVDSHVLMNYIGNPSESDATKPFESEWIRWQTGDLLLLCTDGLYDMVDDADIAEALSQEGDDLEDEVQELVDCAYDSGAKDNVTCLLVSAPEPREGENENE